MTAGLGDGDLERAGCMASGKQTAVRVIRCHDTENKVIY